MCGGRAGLWGGQHRRNPDPLGQQRRRHRRDVCAKDLPHRRPGQFPGLRKLRARHHLAGQRHHRRLHACAARRLRLRLRHRDLCQAQHLRRADLHRRVRHSNRRSGGVAGGFCAGAGRRALQPPEIRGGARPL